VNSPVAGENNRQAVDDPGGASPVRQRHQVPGGDLPGGPARDGGAARPASWRMLLYTTGKLRAGQHPEEGVQGLRAGILRTPEEADELGKGWVKEGARMRKTIRPHHTPDDHEVATRPMKLQVLQVVSLSQLFAAGREHEVASASLADGTGARQRRAALA
jgi:hypothetical protein